MGSNSDTEADKETYVDLLNCAALVLAIPPDKIDLEASFVVNGGDSLKAILLHSMLRSRGYNITREELLTKPTIGYVLKNAVHGPQLGDENISWASSSVTSHPATCSPETTSSTAPSTASSSVSYSALAPECAETSQVPETHVDVEEGPLHDGEHKIAIPAPNHVELNEPQEPSDLFTELQLSLVHETITHCGSNIIIYTETHHPENAETYRQAWMQVLLDEAIFEQSCLGPLFSKQAKMRNATNAGSDSALELEDSNGSDNEWPGWSLDLNEAESVPADQPGTALMEITFKVHHALMDAYSLQALVSKVRARANGIERKPGTSFWDWARLLQRHQEAHKADGDSFWAQTMEKHADAKSHFLLPEPATDSTLHGEAQAQDQEVERIRFALDAGVIETRARELGVTSAAMFYAAWALVVATYADSDSVVFGSVLSGRGLDLPGSLDAIGPVINVLPLHVAIRREATLREFVWGVFLDTVSLEGITWTSTENGFRRDYESALSVEMQLTEAPVETVSSSSLPAMPIGHSARQHSRVPISVTVQDASMVTIDLHANRYRPRDARLVAECYERALDMVSSMTVDGRVEDALQGLLSCPSYSQLMRWGNCITGLTTRASVKDDLVTLFEAAAEANRDGVALEKGDQTMTYAQLQARSDIIRGTLASFVSQGDVVCVHSDRSLDWICAIWGVLKAGCTYCSLDPQLPATYRESMVEAVAAKAFVTATTAQLGEWRPRSVGLAFSVESISSRASGEVPAAPGTMARAQHRPRHLARPHQPAYICFTSGSTGVPKPVVCTHAGLVAFQRDPTVRLGAKPGVRVSQIMSVAFDGSIHEIFSALTYGATLVLPVSSQDVLGVLGKVDSAVLTPSIARALHPADYPGLRSVYLVGEPVPQTVADVWAASKELYNMYGPTEATCGATIKRLRLGENVTIGRPNPSTRIYILNTHGGLSQPGMVGRIHLAGVQISRGYHGMPEQTEAVFGPDQVMGNGEKRYDTGDMGYWDEHGDLVCVGRQDRQLKLRGYRVDLNDLEIRIARVVPEAEAVVVTVRRGGLVDELLAMVQPAGLDTAAIRSRLEGALPRYLIPGHIVATPTIPMTPAGKIDYKAIAAADTCAGASDGAVKVPAGSPSQTGTDMEEMVAAAFLAVLPDHAVGSMIDKNQSFGELGGHSMEQIKLARRLAKALGIPVPLRMVICNPSIKALASAIDQSMSRPVDLPASDSPASPPAPPADRVAPIEADWLEKYRVPGGTSCFNVSSLHRFEPEHVDVDRLERALNSVLQRHSVLRGTYLTSRGPRRPEHRRVPTPHCPRVQRLDARSLDVWAELNRPFQFHARHQEHPVRVFLAHDMLLVVMSHIVADYTALATILRETGALYAGEELLNAQVCTTAYPAEALCGVELTEDLREYWLSTLADVPAPPGILSDAPRRTSYRGRSIVFAFEEAASRQILACRSSRGGVSLQHLGMAAVLLGLVGHGPGTTELEKRPIDVLMGVPHINRGTVEHMETVGLFLQPLPVRIRHGGAPGSISASSLLEAVQESTQAALAREIPWHQLLDLAGCTPDYPEHPLFDVMVSFHEPQMVRQLQMNGVPTLQPCFAWSSGAKFKMMCEFTSVSADCVVLRVEYDDGCLQEGPLRDFIGGVAEAMKTLLTTGSGSESALPGTDTGGEDSLQHEDLVARGTFWDEKALLGTRLSDWPPRRATCT